MEPQPSVRTISTFRSLRQQRTPPNQQIIIQPNTIPLHIINNANAGSAESIREINPNLEQNKWKSKDKKDHAYLQFYSKDLVNQATVPNQCMDNFELYIKGQLSILKEIMITLYYMNGVVGLIVYKSVLSILATAPLLIEYFTNSNPLKSRIIGCCCCCYSYLISIVLVKVIRNFVYSDGRRNRGQKIKLYDKLGTIWFWINTIGLLSCCIIVGRYLTSTDQWEFAYYAFCVYLFFIFIADPLGTLALCSPAITFITLEFIVYIIANIITCGKYYRRKLIPGVHYVPNLYLKKYQKEMEKSLGIMEGSACPICLGKLREGQYVVYMPCGEEHIFHRHCITSWLKEHNVCPTCRAEFEYQNDVSVVSEPPISPLTISPQSMRKKRSTQGGTFKDLSRGFSLKPIPMIIHEEDSGFGERMEREMHPSNVINELGEEEIKVEDIISPFTPGSQRHSIRHGQIVRPSQLLRNYPARIYIAYIF